MFFPIYNNGFDDSVVESIVDIIDKDGLVIIPTDTFYAFACDVNSLKASRRLAELKGKKLEKSNFSIICHNISMASAYTKPISNEYFRILKNNTPGAFTFVFEASNLVPKIFQNKKKCIGIRIPTCDFTLELVKRLERPLLVSSIPTNDKSFEEYSNEELILEEWENRVDAMVGGGCLRFEASTVVNCVEDHYQIIREGCGELDL
ncbi:MAG: L-threonylcarbamoyladenylate synthase [Bacteroidales bacterium]|nr:L-threonylcarbamoyladenylate synthase [Bacteroidales bacterium]